MLGRKGGVEKNIYILCSISVKYLVIIPMLCSLKLKPSSRVQVSPFSVTAVWQNSNQTDHHFVAVQCFIFQHIPTPPCPSQCQIMEPCFFEEYIREADKKLLARHSVTPLGASEEMKDDSLNVPRIHCGTLAGVKSRDVSNLLWASASPHTSTIF